MNLENLECIVELKGKKIVLKTDMNRNVFIKQFIDQNSGAFQDFNIKGSSLGGINLNGTKILIKSRSKANKGLLFEDDFIQELELFKKTGISRFSECFEKLDLLDKNALGRGHLNSKRPILSLLNSKEVENIGNVISDIDLYSSDSVSHHLSLKFGKSYYLYNAGIAKILENDLLRREFLSNIGIDYTIFEEQFLIENKTEITYKINNNLETIIFLEKFIQRIVGFGYSIIHYTDKIEVIDYLSPCVIKIEELEQYYKTLTTKYHAINFTLSINNVKYKTQIQLRNNNGNFIPNSFLINIKGKI